MSPVAATVAYALLGVAALLTLVRIARGPSVLDRAVASEVLVAIVVCALGVEAAVDRRPTTLPILVSLSLLGFLGSVAVVRFVPRDVDPGRSPVPQDRTPGAPPPGDPTYDDPTYDDPTYDDPTYDDARRNDPRREDTAMDDPTDGHPTDGHPTDDDARRQDTAMDDPRGVDR